MAQPRILILGAPGAGKGTQSAKITDEFAVDHITTGDALRNNKEMDISELDTEYDTPGEYMDRGELVPDEVVNAIVDEALSQADGFVLDGYPRNVEQAEELEGMTDLNVVLSLEVGEEELVHRLTGRRMDPETGDIYHVEYNPPEDPDVGRASSSETTTPRRPCGSDCRSSTRTPNPLSSITRQKACSSESTASRHPTRSGRT